MPIKFKESISYFFIQNYSSSYTVTGSTLTLASAPPLNSKVDVRFLGSAAGGGGGGSGTNGTSGSSGSSGTSGTSGSSGESGTSGSSGESGTSGSSGTSGTSGSSGESGTSGSSGSSISLQTGSLYPITASRAITASYALNWHPGLNLQAALF